MTDFKVRLDPELLEAIDEIRGDVPRERFVRSLLRRALTIEVAHTQPAPPPPRSEKPAPQFNRVTSLRR